MWWESFSKDLINTFLRVWAFKAMHLMPLPYFLHVGNISMTCRDAWKFVWWVVLSYKNLQKIPTRLIFTCIVSKHEYPLWNSILERKAPWMWKSLRERCSVTVRVWQFSQCFNRKITVELVIDVTCQTLHWRILDSRCDLVNDLTGCF